MAKRKALKPGKRVKLALTPAEAAKVLKARDRAKLFNAGIDAAAGAVAALLSGSSGGDPLAHGLLQSVAREIAKLRKPEG